MGWFRLVGGTVILGLGLSLAACTSPGAQDSPSPSTSPSAPTSPDSSVAPSASALPTVSQPAPSSNLNGVEATGAFGEAPTVTVPFPWAIDTTQTKVLVAGDGPTVQDAGMVQVNYYGVDGRTGVTFDQSYANGKPVDFSLSGVVPGFQKGLAGQKVGSRVLIAMPGADGYDASGGKSEAGIEIGDTLVFVVDILRTSVTEPSGTATTQADPNLPSVSNDLAAPTVTIPTDKPAPTDVVVVPLITGTGPVVGASDTLVVNYAEYIWGTGAMVRQTYGFSPLKGALTSTLPGWQKALTGQPMGSRLLVVVPPDQAYPEGNPKVSIPKGSTMVYVIDILYTSPNTF
jgi:peptidylprolyl isomerase